MNEKMYDTNERNDDEKLYDANEWNENENKSWKIEALFVYYFEFRSNHST